jgi:hypothetical protein
MSEWPAHQLGDRATLSQSEHMKLLKLVMRRDSTIFRK